MALAVGLLTSCSGQDSAIGASASSDTSSATPSGQTSSADRSAVTGDTSSTDTDLTGTDTDANEPVAVDVPLMPLAADAVDPWSPVVTISYGGQPNQIGQAAYGDGSLWSAAEGCTFDAQNILWLADAAGRRVAGFDLDGRLVADVQIPDEYLVEGRYFQYQGLFALDRRLATVRYATDDSAHVLIIDPEAPAADQFREVSLDRPFQLVATRSPWLILTSLVDGAPFALNVDSEELVDGDQAVGLRGLETTAAAETVTITDHATGQHYVLRPTFAGVDGQELYWGYELAANGDGEIWLSILAATDASSDQLAAVISITTSSGAVDSYPHPYVEDVDRLGSGMFLDPTSGRPHFCVAADTEFTVVALP